MSKCDYRVVITSETETTSVVALQSVVDVTSRKLSLSPGKRRDAPDRRADDFKLALSQLIGIGARTIADSRRFTGFIQYALQHLQFDAQTQS